MSQVNTLYLKQLAEAEEHHETGSKSRRETRDCLVEMLAKPDLGIYPRAKCNWLLAQVLYPASDSKIYANEALDLLDILRQRSGDAFSTNDEKEVEELEDLAKDVLDEFERSRLNDLKNALKPPAPLDDSSRDLGSSSTTISAPETSVRFRTWSLTAEQKKKLAENPSFVLEGFLRRSGKYKPMTPYVPLSRWQDEDAAASTEEEHEEQISEDEDMESGGVELPAEYTQS